MAYFSFLPDHADIAHLFFHKFRRFARLQVFSHGVMRGASPLSVPERELMAAFVSGLNACGFCAGIHRETAVAYGIVPETLDALLHDVETAPVDDRIKGLLRYVKKLTLHPSRVVEQDAHLAYEAGVSEGELHDAVTICALFSLYNRLLDGHGIAGDRKAFENGAGMLKRFGYRLPFIARFFPPK